jgi:DNA-binding transcriptional ArsR family regulator
LSDQLGEVFAALADPTRRGMVQVLLRDGSTSVPALSSDLPISRQAVAKHLATLEDAGLLERLPSEGREVRYGLRGEALTPAAAWLRDAEAGWDRRLGKLKSAVESEPPGLRVG